MPQSVIPGPLAGRLAPIPALRDGFEQFLAACFDTAAVPAATLERCRRLVAALHGADPADCGHALAELPAGRG
jgi:lipase chaperone LimK